MTWLLVALGGAVGAAARYVVDTAVTRWTSGGDWPWGTLVVNVTGSGLLGLVVGLHPGSDVVLLLGAGLCGAFTTASTCAWEVLVVVSRRGRAAAAGYLALTALLSLSALSVARAVGGP